jgi:hypothetical protein
MYINSIPALYGINIASDMCQEFDFILKFLIRNRIALHNLKFKKHEKLFINLHSPVMIYLIHVMNIDHGFYFHGLYCDARCKIFTYIFIHFIHQWLYNPLLVPGLLFSFVIIFTQTVGLLRQVNRSSQGRYLHKETQTQNKRTQTSMP